MDDRVRVRFSDKSRQPTGCQTFKLVKPPLSLLIHGTAPFGLPEPEHTHVKHLCVQYTYIMLDVVCPPFSASESSEIFRVCVCVSKRTGFMTECIMADVAA